MANEFKTKDLETAVLILRHIPGFIKRHLEKNLNSRHLEDKVVLRYIQKKVDYDWAELLFNDDDAIHWPKFHEYLSYIKNKDYQNARKYAIEWHKYLKNDNSQIK